MWGFDLQLQALIQANRQASLLKKERRRMQQQDLRSRGVDRVNATSIARIPGTPRILYRSSSVHVLSTPKTVPKIEPPKTLLEDIRYEKVGKFTVRKRSHSAQIGSQRNTKQVASSTVSVGVNSISDQASSLGSKTGKF